MRQKDRQHETERQRKKRQTLTDHMRQTYRVKQRQSDTRQTETDRDGQR